MNRNLSIVLIIVAFFAGTMTTGGVVYASFEQCDNSPPNGKSNGQPFLEIWDAICDLQDQVDTVEERLDRAPQTYILSKDAHVDGGGQFKVVMTCNGNDIALSGGYSTVDNSQIDFIESYPGIEETKQDNSWTIQGANRFGHSGSDYTTWIKCFDVDG